MSEPVHPNALVSPHSGVIQPHVSTAAGVVTSAPHVPSSPLPQDYVAEEPQRNNRDSLPRTILFSGVSGQYAAASAAAAASCQQSSPPPTSPLSTSLPSARSGSMDSACLSLPQGRHCTPRRSISTGSGNSSGNGATKKMYKIFYCPSMASVAQALVKLDDRFVLTEINWSHFADGFPNLFIHDAPNVKNYHVCFLANFHNPAVFFEQFSVITALPKLLPKSFKLFLPFFPTGTMERVSRLGEVATANTLARILSTIPVCSKGPAQICVFDIHALQNQFYFKDTVLIRLGTCVNLLLERIRCLPDASNVNIAFPDDGAAKRFGDLFEHFPFRRIICHKVRGEGDKRIVKLKEGDVQGKHCIIVDDLVQSGSTLIECGKELLRAGAACVSAYVTHAIFPQESYKKFLTAGLTPDTPQLFQYFFVTDSNPHVADKLRGQAPFEVLCIAPNIREIILDEERAP